MRIGQRARKCVVCGQPTPSAGGQRDSGLVWFVGLVVEALGHQAN